MRVSDITIEKIITQAGLVNESKLTDLKNEAENSAQPLQDVVLHQRLASDDTLTKMIGVKLFSNKGHKELSKLDESSFTHDQQIVYNYYLKLLRVLGEAYALTIKNMVSGITSDVMSYVKISIGVFKLVGVETETTNNIVPSENESPKPKESIFGKVKNIFSKKN